jgi:hypothetical protein
MNKQEQINTLHKALICLIGVGTRENDTPYVLKCIKHVTDVIEDLMKEKKDNEITKSI